ncbi:hypothetical protein [Brevibacillus fulvus]|uniref:Lipoprotein n=1 Tax=Brevibacillus fulvus TaxID=1125967 RepID=A0A939BUT3_9BACL|nr:hypothetical protein [Brevibacillus fulvus]MBM7590764.1 hypothetical protein [Brevibacillus fulvus]
MMKKTSVIVSMFLTASLAVSGCSSTTYSNSNDCYDGDNDGYCDDDSGSSGSSSGSTYRSYSSGSSKYAKNPSAITTGAKGGIGSSSHSSSS